MWAALRVRSGVLENWWPAVSVQIEKLRIFRTVSGSVLEISMRIREALLVAVSAVHGISEIAVGFQ